MRTFSVGEHEPRNRFVREGKSLPALGLTFTRLTNKLLLIPLFFLTLSNILIVSFFFTLALPLEATRKLRLVCARAINQAGRWARSTKCTGQSFANCDISCYVIQNIFIQMYFSGSHYIFS